MKLNPQNAFQILALLFLGLAACSIEKKSSDYSDKYKFELNGCSTGEHSFSGSSEEEVRRQYCETLKNDSANNNCADSMRYETFRARCQGYQWN